MNLIITNARIVDPSQGMDRCGHIFIEHGKIKEMVDATLSGHEPQWLAKSGPYPGITLVDASGLCLFPGLVDMHAHLREPGFEYKETIRTGTMAAVKGGFTSVCCMPNTNPVNDNETVTYFIIRKAKSEGSCDVFPIGAITKKEEGLEIAEMGKMREAGCVAFSDDGRPVSDSWIMRRALEYARVFDAPLISHAEDLSLSADGVMNEGDVSTLLGLKGIPAESEVIMIKRDIELAALTRGKLHIAHVSTEGGVQALREAKRAGIAVTAETCPHYFTITEEEVMGYNTYAKVNPPLRTGRDRQAIREGLADDTIDVIATDHAPHHIDDKLCEFDRAAFGISGFETALPLSLALVDEGVLTLDRLIHKMTAAPARILGLSKGTLKPGEDGDMVLVDLDRQYTVDGSAFLSSGKNTPFNGRKVKGMAVATVFKGAIVYTDDSLMERIKKGETR